MLVTISLIFLEFQFLFLFTWNLFDDLLHLGNLALEYFAHDADSKN